MLYFALRGPVWSAGRALIGVAGVGLALVVILLPWSLYASVAGRYTAWIEHQDADVVVTTGAMNNAFVGTSRVSARTVEQVTKTPGVARATGVQARVGTLTLHDRRFPVYFVGYDPATGDGGPWRLEQGSPRIGADEVILDAALAHDQGLKLGDALDFGRERLRIAGLSADTNAGYHYVFLDRSTAAKLFGAADVFTFVLVKATEAGQAGTVAQRLDATVPNASAFTRAAFAANTRGVLQEGTLAPLRLVVALAFLLGTGVLALAVYTSAQVRGPEYALLRTLGASRFRLFIAVLFQAIFLGLAGLAAGGALTLVVGFLLNRLTPRVTVLPEPVPIFGTLVLTFLMALLAALPPARRVLRTDPLLVFHN